MNDLHLNMEKVYLGQFLHLQVYKIELLFIILLTKYSLNLFIFQKFLFKLNHSLFLNLKYVSLYFLIFNIFPLIILISYFIIPLISLIKN